MYEALAGRPPFEAPTTSALLVAILGDKIRPLSELCPECPVGLERVVHKALAREPAHRYQSAEEMAADLEAVALERSLPRGDAAWATSPPCPTPTTGPRGALAPRPDAGGASRERASRSAGREVSRSSEGGGLGVVRPARAAAHRRRWAITLALMAPAALAAALVGARAVDAASADDGAAAAQSLAPPSTARVPEHDTSRAAAATEREGDAPARSAAQAVAVAVAAAAPASEHDASRAGGAQGRG